MAYRLTMLLLIGSIGFEIGCDPPAANQPTVPAVPSTPDQPPSPPQALSRPAERVENKTFDDLVFDIEPDQPFERPMLTPEIEAMNGSRITIRGYILPTAQKRGIRQFVLVRDNMECCFGPGAALYDCILVEMTSGNTAEFSVFPVAVTGTFRIEEFIGPGGRHLAVFQMRGDSVQ